MKKYLLHTDGSIINREDSNDKVSRSDVKDIDNALSNSIYKNKNLEDVENIVPSATLLKNKIFSGFEEESIPGVDNTEILYKDKKRLELEKISSFDFISEDSSEKIYSYSSYNEFDKVFAKEFEMLTGWSPPTTASGDSNYRFNSIFAFLGDAIEYISLLEIITEINRVILGNNNVVENYSFRYGSYTIKGIDIYSKFIFEKLNFPKENISIDERIASFIIGFIMWIKPDRLLDFDQLIKELMSDAEEEINNFLELTSISDNGKTNIIYNNPFTMLTLPLLFYALESFLAINGSLEKRVDLLFNKFAMERIWNDNLYNAKNDENEEDSTTTFFRELDYYYVKFYIERMHVGSKILRNVLQKASYLPLFTKDTPSSRVGGGKYYKTSGLSIENNDKGKYKWSSKNTKQQEYKFEQVTRIRALPQGLLLNDSLIKDIFSVQKPGAKLVNIGKDLLQNFYKPKNSEGNRLPGTLVKQIEEHLESEYMPFYFHDLRTNEIISFHAFLSNISDSFNPGYDTVTGFGRIEGAKIYKNTSRSINLSFNLVSTSKKDFDLMWYQVNKLVSMCYPQFSKGITAKKIEEGKLEDANFSYPFTQLPTASPLIRLRVGDLIKSNYSMRNIARLHEIKSRDISKALKDLQGSNNSETAASVTPFPIDILAEPKDDKSYILLPGLHRDNFNFITEFSMPPKFDLTQGYANIKRPVKVKKPENSIGIGINRSVNVEVDDPESNFHGTLLTVDARSVVEYFPHKKQSANTQGQFEEDTSMIETKSIVTSMVGENINNPITKAYESGMGRGMAGVIESFSVGDLHSAQWETSEVGSRGPMTLKLQVKFTPIHDITPGLDYTGMMRAPAYNIGKINNEMFGDVYDTHKKSGLEETKSNVLKINKAK